MKPTVISADAMFEEFRGSLRWEWLAGLGASERQFDAEVISRAQSAADLVGYLNYIHPYRVQILGAREVAYLTRGSEEDCARRRHWMSDGKKCRAAYQQPHAPTHALRRLGSTASRQ